MLRAPGRGEPAGTLSLIASDLDERPDLTPWLAGMFVAPRARERGYATRLIQAVEEAARAAGVSILWLYTHEAQGLYLRAGWEGVEDFIHAGRAATLMRRDLRVPPVRRGGVRRLDAASASSDESGFPEGLS